MDMEELARKAREAASHSYAPYSGVQVGAALETDTGAIYEGCNVENASFSLTLCAERVAIFKAVSDGAKSFRRIAIWSNTGFFLPPCGACLQVLSEWLPNGADVFLVREDMEIEARQFRDLLPVDLDNLRNHLK